MGLATPAHQKTTCPINHSRFPLTIGLPARKSSFRAGFREGSGRGSLKIGSPAGRRADFRPESIRNPAGRPDFWPGGAFAEHRVIAPKDYECHPRPLRIKLTSPAPPLQSNLLLPQFALVARLEAHCEKLKAPSLCKYCVRREFGDRDCAIKV